MPSWPRVLIPINIKQQRTNRQKVLLSKTMPMLGARAGIKTGSRAETSLKTKAWP